ncbi:MAG: type II toxin-antitoxin system HicA family toxin [Deltaproteobacteria bacterium]|nr:type II toxin-antitoxin system HicA family toxin [Deltaproteobacteria bacterium]
MPKLPRLTAEEAERILLKAGFEHVRTKGSHKIYRRDKERRQVASEADIPGH